MGIIVSDKVPVTNCDCDFIRNFINERFEVKNGTGYLHVLSYLLKLAFEMHIAGRHLPIPEFNSEIQLVVSENTRDENPKDFSK